MRAKFNQNSIKNLSKIYQNSIKIKSIILPQSPTTGIFILTYPLQHYAITDGGGSADDGHGSDGGEMDIVCAEQLLAHSYTQNVK